jgi:putative transposase
MFVVACLWRIVKSDRDSHGFPILIGCRMRDVLILFVHLIGTFIRIATVGGIRSVIAESVLVKHQLLILNRSRKRAPNLRTWDRIIAGLCVALMRPARVIRSAIVLRPSTLLHFHHILVQGKYRLLFSPKQRRKRGPKGPSTELIDAIVEMKRRNPNWGCPRIAQQITLAFGIRSIRMSYAVFWATTTIPNSSRVVHHG